MSENTRNPVRTRYLELATRKSALVTRDSQQLPTKLIGKLAGKLGPKLIQELLEKLT
jgi:hypothetical protein